MPFVTTQPDMLAAAAGQLAGVGSELTAQNAAAMYRAVSAHASAVHDLFVSALGASADSYRGTEAANAASAI
jgi:hypothetical protein